MHSGAAAARVCYLRQRIDSLYGAIAFENNRDRSWNGAFVSSLEREKYKLQIELQTFATGESYEAAEKTYLQSIGFV